MKNKGPSLKQQNNIKLVFIGKKLASDVVKVRKPRVKGYKVNRDEDKLRPLIILELKRNGWKAKRVEPYGRGEFGLGDLWIWSCYRKLAGWAEIKTPTGKLTGAQPAFKQACYDCGINYWVLRSIDDVKDIS